MIIRSLSRKTANFDQLISYINNKKNNNNSPTIFHNLKTQFNDQHAIITEFLENFSYCPQRKNGNVMFHEILSFSPQDKPFITHEILQDITKKYLEFRAKNALGYAKFHTNTNNIHVHIVISANLIKSSKKLRLSRKQFSILKKDIELYQKQKYPFLTNSIVFEKKNCPQKTNKENELLRRLSKQKQKPLTLKDKVIKAVENSLNSALSEEDFLDKIKNYNYDFYLRGKTQGIKDLKSGRKFRLKTLGLDLTYFKALERWQKASKRQKKLNNMSLKKALIKWQEMGFRDDIFGLFNETDLSERENQLCNIYQKKRKNKRKSIYKKMPL